MTKRNIQPAVPEHKRRKRRGLSKLSEKAQALVDAYLTNGFNPGLAAKQAGYNVGSDQTARAIAWRVLGRQDVCAYIRKMMDKQSITTERILGEIAQVAMGQDLADFEPFLSGETLAELRARGVDTRLVKGFKVTRTTTTGKDGEKTIHETRSIDTESRLRALEQLAKIRRMVDGGADAAGPEPPTVRVDVVEAIGRMIEGVVAAIPPNSDYFTAPVGRLPVVDCDVVEPEKGQGDGEDDDDN